MIIVIEITINSNNNNNNNNYKSHNNNNNNNNTNIRPEGLLATCSCRAERSLLALHSNRLQSYQIYRTPLSTQPPTEYQLNLFKSSKINNQIYFNKSKSDQNGSDKKE